MINISCFLLCHNTLFKQLICHFLLLGAEWLQILKRFDPRQK